MSRPTARFFAEARARRLLNVKEDGIMTFTAAAKRLGLSKSAMGNLIFRRVLRRLEDREEPNSTKANRVLVEDLARELARRRQPHTDAKLKYRRGRTVVLA